MYMSVGLDLHTKRFPSEEIFYFYLTQHTQPWRLSVRRILDLVKGRFYFEDKGVQ